MDFLDIMNLEFTEHLTVIYCIHLTFNIYIEVFSQDVTCVMHADSRA